MAMERKTIELAASWAFGLQGIGVRPGTVEDLERNAGAKNTPATGRFGQFVVEFYCSFPKRLG
jgi:hypothetical protein